jgi:acetoin utilization deacetylase AcuC-like enzyme
LAFIILIIGKISDQAEKFMEDLVYFYPEGHENHNERGHPERPERVEAIRESLLIANLWNQFQKLAPYTLTNEIIQYIHSPAYLNLLEMTCRMSGHLDTDTYTTTSSWDLANRTAGGAAAVASYVWERKARRGFALTRPPGHHATHGQGMGFCLLNNIAISAEYLIRYYQVQKLAIIDLDLHHGNGTQDIFWRSNEVLYISIHQSPFYPGTGYIDEIGEGVGEGWTANFPLPPGSGDVAFNMVLDELILPLLDQRNPQMILVSYGFDTHWLDPLGQMYLTANGYGNLIKKLCDWADSHCEGRISLFLEGGYDLNAAAACSLAVVSAMMGRNWEDPYPCPHKESEGWQRTLLRAKSIWSIK